MHPKISMSFTALLPKCCPLWSTSHSHGSPSNDRVFLTGYRRRQTHRGRNCSRPYPIPRCILKILEQLSTFTFRQPARWVGLTNSKSTSLCQSTIPHSTTVYLFYSVLDINIPNIVWDSCGMRYRSQISTTTSINKTTFLRNEADPAHQSVLLKCW